MLTLYGIKNCDSVRQARRWLDHRGIAYRFHDLRTDGLRAELLQRWADGVSWQSLLNRRSSTWRQLPESKRLDLDNERAIALMLEHPTLIARPVLDDGKRVPVVRFDEPEYARRFG